MEVGGVRLRNRLLLASGILGNSSSLLRRALEAGAGGVVTKTVTPGPREGNLPPVVHELEFGLLNSMGLPNPGAVAFREELDPLQGEPVIVSVGGSSTEDFLRVVDALDDLGFEGYELNLSCPNVPGMGDEIGSDPAAVREIVSAVAGSTEKPVWAKLTPNVRDIVELGLAAQDAGASAVVAINTVRATEIDVRARSFVLSTRSGGLSGPAIRPIALLAVLRLSQELEIPVVGVGGISSGEDLIKFAMAGASAFQIGTVLARMGYSAFRSILSEANGILAELGFEDLGEVIGLAHRW